MVMLSISHSLPDHIATHPGRCLFLSSHNYGSGRSECHLLEGQEDSPQMACTCLLSRFMQELISEFDQPLESMWSNCLIKNRGPWGPEGTHSEFTAELELDASTPMPSIGSPLVLPQRGPFGVGGQPLCCLFCASLAAGIQ